MEYGCSQFLDELLKRGRVEYINRDGYVIVFYFWSVETMVY